MHWTERQRAVARIGEELQRRGFTLYGYTQDKSDPMTDYYAPATCRAACGCWDGVATHPDHPNVVVCVDATRTSQSGRDGWPTFHVTPKGKTWHVERDGQIVKTGVGLQRCARCTCPASGAARGGEQGQAATEALVDKIAAVVTGDDPSHAQVAATAARLQAALELGRRLLSRATQKQQIRSPADAASLLIPEMSLLEKEHLRVLLLDTKNYLIGMPTIYVGSVNTNLIRVAEIFKPAITHNAVAIIVAHNHPSGLPDPSPGDVVVTRRIVETGQLIDVEVLDHLIIGAGRFVSLKERGLGFS